MIPASLLRLGAGFWALLGGAFISVSIAVYIDTLQGDELPSDWGILLACAVCFGACGLAWVLLSMSLERLNASISEIPRSLGESARTDLVAELRDGAMPQLARFFWLGTVGGVAGLLLLPIRVLV